MLHLACGIAFGMDIGNFLQLQRAFQSDWIEGTAAKIKCIPSFRHLVSKLAQALIVVQELRRAGWNFAKSRGKFRLALGRDTTTRTGHGQRKAG